MTRGTKVKQDRAQTNGSHPARRRAPAKKEEPQTITRAILVDFGPEGNGPISASPQGVAAFEIPTLLRRAANELEAVMTKASG